ncbi:MAG: GDSL-type esterase/lipase family protein [Bacteroidota bacterium]|nr:GDSL-type esterase/lipase family protein [Bacteroidota bacterium]MDP4226042.1 GDSL-type esterase/lipase family protein [Bacteroidota bacterium]MDP4274765.1 GDSL-type esterase/lipase family protein [Bacteroidota bacterium]
MKIQSLGIILTCLLGIAGSSNAQTQLTNQNLFDTISFMPEHYVQRVAVFKKQPVVTGKIIFLGNSITEMGKWGKLLGDTTVINRGIGGDITFGVLKRLDDVTRRKPSKLFLLIGINDIGKDIPDAVIANNVKKIILEISKKCPETKIYLESILPVNPTLPKFPQHYDKQGHIISTNRLLVQVAQSTHCQFVNLYPLLLDNQKNFDRRYTLEGLHPNPKGFELIVKYLKEKGCL